MTQLPCKHTHASFNVPMDLWHCPQCASGTSHFYIDESMNEECCRLHKNDRVTCTKCCKTWTGEQIARLIQKKTEVITCPHCKGAGHIKKGS